MAEKWTAVLARLGTPTGDGRVLSPGGITNRDLPMPLMWQEKTGEGHSGAVTVGSIDTIEYTADMVTASGTFLELFPDKERVFELIRAGVVGPSVDLADNVEYVINDSDQAVITSAGIGGVTLVPIEAFAEVSIHMSADDTAIAAPVLTAAAAPFRPPLTAFANPHFEQATAVHTKEMEGWTWVGGHVAAWGVCHVGLPGCVTAPSSVAEYAYFMTGAEITSDGVEVPVGKLTVGGGHAEPNAGFVAAADHYDDVGTAVASVFAGEDEHGIWVSGWVLPGTSHEALSALLRSPLSGDWRRIGGNLELIAAHAVNVPGFPIPRARVKFSAGNQISLIAAAQMPEVVEEQVKELAGSRSEALAAQARWGWKMRQMKGRG